MIRTLEGLESRSLFSGGFGGFLSNLGTIWSDPTVQADLTQIKTDAQALKTAIAPLLQQANDIRVAAQPELRTDFQSLVAAYRSGDSAAVTSARADLKTDLQTLQTNLQPIYDDIRTTSEPFQATLRDDRTKLFNDIKAIAQGGSGTTTTTTPSATSLRQSLFASFF